MQAVRSFIGHLNLDYLGASLAYAKQRDYDRGLGLLDYDVITGHVSAYWATPFYNYDVAVHAGRYLAKDIGATLEVRRTFRNGWQVGAWATLTDVPFEDFGEVRSIKAFIFRSHSTRYLAVTHDQNWERECGQFSATVVNGWKVIQVIFSGTPERPGTTPLRSTIGCCNESAEEDFSLVLFFFGLPSCTFSIPQAENALRQMKSLVSEESSGEEVFWLAYEGQGGFEALRWRPQSSLISRVMRLLSTVGSCARSLGLVSSNQ